IPDPPWASVRVFPPEPAQMFQALEEAKGADLIVKASGLGVLDELLESAVLDARLPGTLVAFWDVDAPATLDRMKTNPDDPFRSLISRYDVILTYGGGDPVVSAYEEAGARACVPIYNALDDSTHYHVPPDPRFAADLAFLGNRLPDREARVNEFFFDAAVRTPAKEFIIGGSGWGDRRMPANV